MEAARRQEITQPTPSLNVSRKAANDTRGGSIQQAANVPPPGSIQSRDYLKEIRDILKSNPRATASTPTLNGDPIDVQQLKVLGAEAQVNAAARPIAAPTSDAVASQAAAEGLSATDVAKVKAAPTPTTGGTGTSDASTTAETKGAMAAQDAMATAAGNVGPASPADNLPADNANRRDDALTQNSPTNPAAAMGAPAANDPSLANEVAADPSKTKDMVAGLSPRIRSVDGVIQELNRRMGAISAPGITSAILRGNANVFYSNGGGGKKFLEAWKRNPNMAASSDLGGKAPPPAVAYLYHFLGAWANAILGVQFIRDNIQKAQRGMMKGYSRKFGIPRVNQMDPAKNPYASASGLFQFVNGTWDGVPPAVALAMAKAESGFNYTKGALNVPNIKALITDAANMMVKDGDYKSLAEKYPIEMLGRGGVRNYAAMTTGSSSINLSDIPSGTSGGVPGNLGQVVDAVDSNISSGDSLSSDGARASGYRWKDRNKNRSSLEVTGEDEEEADLAVRNMIKAIKNNGKRAANTNPSSIKAELETLKLLSKLKGGIRQSVWEVNINPLGGDLKLTGGYLYEISLMMSTAYSVFMTYLVGVKRYLPTADPLNAIGTPKEDRLKRWFFDRFLPVKTASYKGDWKKAIASMVPDDNATRTLITVFEKNVIKDIDQKDMNAMESVRWKTYGFTTIGWEDGTEQVQIQVDWNAVLDAINKLGQLDNERNKNLAKVEARKYGMAPAVEGIKSAGVDEVMEVQNEVERAIKFRMDDKKFSKAWDVVTFTPKEFLSGEETKDAKAFSSLTDPRKVNQGFGDAKKVSKEDMQTLFNKMKMYLRWITALKSMPNSIQLADVEEKGEMLAFQAFMLQRFIPILRGLGGKDVQKLAEGFGINVRYLEDALREYVSYAEDGQASLAQYGFRDYDKWSSDDGAKAGYAAYKIATTTYTQYLDKMRAVVTAVGWPAILIGGAIAAAKFAVTRLAAPAVSAVATAASTKWGVLKPVGLLGKAAWNVGPIIGPIVSILGTVGNILGSIEKAQGSKGKSGGLWDMVKGLEKRDYFNFFKRWREKRKEKKGIIRTMFAKFGKRNKPPESDQEMSWFNTMRESVSRAGGDDNAAKSAGARLFERLDRMIGLAKDDLETARDAAGRVINKGKFYRSHLNAKGGLSGRKVYGDIATRYEVERRLAGRDDDVAESGFRGRAGDMLDGYRGARHDRWSRTKAFFGRGRDRLRGWFRAVRGAYDRAKSSLSERFGGDESWTEEMEKGVGGGGSTIGNHILIRIYKLLNQRLPGDPEGRKDGGGGGFSLFSSTGKKTRGVDRLKDMITDNPLTRWWKLQKAFNRVTSLPGKVLGFAKIVGKIKDWLNEIPEGEEKTRNKVAKLPKRFLDFLSPKAGSKGGKIQALTQGLASKIGLGFAGNLILAAADLAAAGKLRYYKMVQLKTLDDIKLGSDIVDSNVVLQGARLEAGEYYQVIDGAVSSFGKGLLGIRDVYDDHGPGFLTRMRGLISGSVRGGFELNQFGGWARGKVAGMGGGEGDTAAGIGGFAKRGVKGAWNKRRRIIIGEDGLIRRWGGVLFGSGDEEMGPPRPGGGSGGGREHVRSMDEEGVLLASLAGGADGIIEAIRGNNNSDTLQKILNFVELLSQRNRGEEAPRNNFKGRGMSPRQLAAVLYGETSTQGASGGADDTSLPPALRGGGEIQRKLQNGSALGDYLRRMNLFNDLAMGKTRSGRALTRDQNYDAKSDTFGVDKDLSDPYTIIDEAVNIYGERALRDAGIFSNELARKISTVQSSITQRQARIKEALQGHSDSLTGGSNELEAILKDPMHLHRYMPGNAAERQHLADYIESRASQGRAFDVNSINSTVDFVDRGKTLSQKDVVGNRVRKAVANDEQRLRLQYGEHADLEYDITSRGFVDRKSLVEVIPAWLAEINKSVRRGDERNGETLSRSAKFDRKAYLFRVLNELGIVQPLNREKAFLLSSISNSAIAGETQGPLADLMEKNPEVMKRLQKGAFTFGNLAKKLLGPQIEKLQKWTREETAERRKTNARDKATAWGSGFESVLGMGVEDDFGMSDSSSLIRENTKKKISGIFGEGRGLLKRQAAEWMNPLRYADGFMDMNTALPDYAKEDFSEVRWANVVKMKQSEFDRNTPALEAIVKNIERKKLELQYRTLFAIQDIMIGMAKDINLLTGLSRGVFLVEDKLRDSIKEMRADAMHQTDVFSGVPKDADEQRQLQDRMDQLDYQNYDPNQALMDRELGTMKKYLPDAVTKRIDKWSKSKGELEKTERTLKMQARQLGPDAYEGYQSAAAAAKDIYAHTIWPEGKRDQVILKGMPKPAAKKRSPILSTLNVARKSALSTDLDRLDDWDDFGEPPRPKDESS
ncbi:putative phage tail fiber protein [Salmonella phage SPFM20]|nr:putative phage tail fiber protein [Salmonella phage SPFM20]